MSMIDAASARPVSSTPAGGVVDADRLEILLNEARRKGARIGLCHGCFDLVHPGHLAHFEEAHRHCDVLVVSITADAFINKGPGRPVFDQAQRSNFLAGLRTIDAVYITNEPAAFGVIDLVRPHLYFKGIDYAEPSADVTCMIAQERARVERHGGALFITETPKSSSTKLIQDSRLADLPPQVQDWMEKARAQTSLDEVLSYVEDKFSRLDIGVFGDLIIDEYVSCTPVGTTSKAPTISAIYRNSELMAGGSAAIARHLSQYARHVTLVCQKGERNWKFDNLMASSIADNLQIFWVRNPDGFTPQKIRFLSTGYPNTLNTGAATRSEETPVKLFEYAFLNTDKSDGVLLLDALGDRASGLLDIRNLVWADFGHGLLGRDAWQLVRDSASFIALNVQTNSTNFGFNLVSKYPGADLICIDELEARLALHDRDMPFDSIPNSLRTALHCADISVTRGKAGIVIANSAGTDTVPGLAQKIIDPVGAGDAVLSMMTLSRLADAPAPVAGILAGAAGALACQIVGNRTPVQKSSLIKYVTGLF